MNYGFDIDGTITGVPALVPLMAALIQAGHTVHVLTGTVDLVADDDHYEGRRQQLRTHGVYAGQHYDALHIVTAPHAQQKAEYCAAHNIVLMIDDAPSYIEAIAANGVTKVLAVHP